MERAGEKAVSPMRGEQLYGWRRAWAMLRMGLSPELKTLTWSQKSAIFDVARESKLTRLESAIYSNTFTPFFPSKAYDRFLRTLVRTAEGIPTPGVANFAVIARCICRCWHCSFSNRDPAESLTFEELKGGIRQALDLGASVLGFTGGEPLLRPDLEALIESVDERAMPLVFTTGYGLTAARVRALKGAGLKIPVVSLDHYSAEAHDRGRGVPGVFEAAVKAIELFKNAGLYTAVSFVPTRQLLEKPEEAFKCIEFFRDLGVNDMRLTSPILSGRLTSHPEEALLPEHVETLSEIQRMCTRTPGYPNVFAYDYFESERLYGCTAGFNYLFVDARGNVGPCDFTMMSFGNLREKPLARIWESMSKRFSTPGCGCYATKIAAAVAEVGAKTWPLTVHDSEKICSKCPPNDPMRVPLFYRRLMRKP